MSKLIQSAQTVLFFPLKRLPVSFCFSENWWNAWCDVVDGGAPPSTDLHFDKQIHSCISCIRQLESFFNMAETSLTTDRFLETMSIDPLSEDSPMEMGDLSTEEDTVLLCGNPGEDEEAEDKIPCAQANQELVNTNQQLIETRKAKQSVDVHPAILSKSNERGGNVPETSMKSPPKQPAAPMLRTPTKMTSRQNAFVTL